MINRAKAVIIGGGIAGTSVAANMAKHRKFEPGDVFLVEAHQGYGQGTTSIAAGMFSNTMMDSENLIRLNKGGMEGALKFKETFGSDLYFMRCGNLLLALTDEDAFKCEKQAELQNRYGIDTQILTRREVEEQFPFINATEIKAAMYCGNDGYIDVQEMVDGYVRYAKQRGVTMRPHTWVDGIKPIDDGGFEVRIKSKIGERIDEDMILTEKVVNAAGALAPEVSGWVGVQLPIDLWIRDIWSVRVNSLGSRGRELFPLVAIEGKGHQHQHSYIRRDGDRFLVGVGPMRKFEGEITDFNMQVPPEGGEEVGKFVENFFPGAEIENMNGHAAIRAHAAVRAHPTTNEGGPLLGPYQEEKNLKGFIECNGMGGHGIQWAPKIGEDVADFIMEGKISGEMEIFSPVKEAIPLINFEGKQRSHIEG